MVLIDMYCHRYDGVDAASSMAVVSIAMISGWIPEKSSIQKVCLYNFESNFKFAVIISCK